MCGAARANGGGGVCFIRCSQQNRPRQQTSSSQLQFMANTPPITSATMPCDNRTTVYKH